MDHIDRQLLDLMQYEFPLVQKPFAELGISLEIDEDEVIRRVKKLTDEEIVRQIGPIYSSKHIGYHSTLAAFSVDPERLNHVADEVSLHQGVSHNYARDHEYNLWFTLTMPREKDLQVEIERMAEGLCISDYLFLPSIKTFRLGVHFGMSQKNGSFNNQKPQAKSSITELTEYEKDVIRETQGDLLLISRPFAPQSDALGITEEKLLEVLRDFEHRGIMRRYAAVLRHRKAGYQANGMGCWTIPEERVSSSGMLASEFSSVSHCYHRPAYPPKWPYNLFTMVHGHNKNEVEREIEEIRKAIQPIRYTILYSLKEFKKERVRYFEEIR